MTNSLQRMVFFSILQLTLERESILRHRAYSYNSFQRNAKASVKEEEEENSEKRRQ